MLEVGCAQCRRHVGALNDASHATWSRASFRIEAANVVESMRTIWNAERSKHILSWKDSNIPLCQIVFAIFAYPEIHRRKKAQWTLRFSVDSLPRRLPSVIIEDSLLSFFLPSLPLIFLSSIRIFALCRLLPFLCLSCQTNLPSLE